MEDTNPDRVATGLSCSGPSVVSRTTALVDGEEPKSDLNRTIKPDPIMDSQA